MRFHVRVQLSPDLLETESFRRMNHSIQSDDPWSHNELLVSTHLKNISQILGGENKPCLKPRPKKTSNALDP